jgi:hypothetical protein
MPTADLPFREQQRRRRLLGECRRYRITHESVARPLGIDPSLVSHWLAGRVRDNREIDRAIRAAIDDAKAAS